MVVGNHPDPNARRMCKIQNCSRRQSATPKESINLAVLERVYRLRNPEALFLNCGCRIDAKSLENTKCRYFCTATCGARRDDLSLQIAYSLNGTGSQCDNLRVVGVQHRDCAQRQFGAFESPGSIDGVS